MPADSQVRLVRMLAASGAMRFDPSDMPAVIDGRLDRHGIDYGYIAELLALRGVHVLPEQACHTEAFGPSPDTAHLASQERPQPAELRNALEHVLDVWPAPSPEEFARLHRIVTGHDSCDHTPQERPQPDLLPRCSECGFVVRSDPARHADGCSQERPSIDVERLATAFHIMYGHIKPDRLTPCDGCRLYGRDLAAILVRLSGPVGE